MSDKKVVIVKYDPNAELLGWIFRMVIIIGLFWQTSVQFHESHYLQGFIYAIGGLIFASPEVIKIFKVIMAIVKAIKK